MSGFGERLRIARKASGLTLEQLGEKLGSSKAYVWQLENKTEASPSGELLMKLCAALDKQPSYFLDASMKSADDLAESDVLFRKFKALDERDRQTILSLIGVMDQNGKKP
jgi:Predicted transcriptional regulators